MKIAHCCISCVVYFCGCVVPVPWAYMEFPNGLLVDEPGLRLDLGGAGGGPQLDALPVRER